MFAGIAGGIYVNCDEAIDKCVKLEKSYEPNMERHNIYEGAYQLWSEAYHIVNGTFYKDS